jgi:hypothetical protein
MRRVTKWLVAAAAVGGVGLAAGSAAAAYPPVVVTPAPVVVVRPPVVVAPPVIVAPRVDTDYVVLYRACAHDPWVSYGKFETLHQARHLERSLERSGYQVVIRPVRDHHHGPYVRY